MNVFKNGVVISNDIDLILQGKNALKFNYQENGLYVPDTNFIETLREDFKKDSIKAYQEEVNFVTEEEMSYYMNKYLDEFKGYFPIVSMDEIYIDCDNKYVFSLDCTRMTGQDKLVSRINPLDVDGVGRQIERLAKLFKRCDVNQIILADDVVYSGSVISQISNLFEQEDIMVVGVVAAISGEKAYNKFNKEMKYGLKCGYLMKEDVTDEICERDFYFGVAQSGMGILVNGKVFKAPYFLPFGDPIARATIPAENAVPFSKSCVRRSLELWLETQKRSNKTIYMKDLPELVQNTTPEEEVVKVLRKAL